MQVTVSVSEPSTEANTYILGMAIRLFVPITYSMKQANNLVGTIIAINGSTFSLSLDSSNFDPFVIPMGSVESPASISPAGSRNLQYDNTNVQFVPFRNLNNIGN